MSNYGPPGGPYPGPGPEPWPVQQPGQRPTRPYGPGPQQGGGYVPGPRQGDGYGTGPAPWRGGSGQWGGPANPEEPGYGSGQRYDPGFTGGPAPGWTTPEPTPPRKSRVPLIALLVTLVVLLCGGGGIALYLVGRDGGGTPTAAPTAGATTAGPSTEPSTAAEPGTPEPESSTNARFVKPGQCLKNEGGTPEKPNLVITTCGPKTYQVLQRFDGATNGKEDAVAKCAKVEGYTDWYFFNSDLDALDYVLCLKLR